MKKLIDICPDCIVNFVTNYVNKNEHITIYLDMNAEYVTNGYEYD